MRYIRRDPNGKVNAHFSHPYPDAQELVADDHPDIVAWHKEREDERLRPKRLERAEAAIADLLERVAKLEKK